MVRVCQAAVYVVYGIAHRYRVSGREHRPDWNQVEIASEPTGVRQIAATISHVGGFKPTLPWSSVEKS